MTGKTELDPSAQFNGDGLVRTIFNPSDDIREGLRIPNDIGKRMDADQLMNSPYFAVRVISDEPFLIEGLAEIHGDHVFGFTHLGQFRYEIHGTVWFG
jgi:hypothetical protein